MTHPSIRLSALSLALTVAASGVAIAGTKFQTNLVPNTASAAPGFSANGSSMFINGHRALKGKIKKVVDGVNALVTTDGLATSGDEYLLEIDLTVPSTAVAGTITVPMELKKGNGKFSADLAADPVFAGAALGAGVSVTAIRVKDNVGTVLGIGGFAIE